MAMPDTVFAEFADPDNKNSELFMRKSNFLNGAVVCVTLYVSDVRENKCSLNTHSIAEVTGEDLKRLRAVNGI